MIAALTLLLAQSVPPASALTESDAKRVMARAQPVLDRFYSAVKRCGARPPFKPTIKVAASDGIIHYDPPTGQLMLYAWPLVGGEMRTLSIARATLQHIDPREAYESVFNDLLVAHELGHWLQGFQPERRITAGVYDNWFAEMNANRIMVAFWRMSETAQAAEKRLHAYLGADTANPVPPPPGMALEAFFTTQTMQIVKGNGYGWYQGEMTRRAMAEKPAVRFCTLVSEWLPLRD